MNNLNDSYINEKFNIREKYIPFTEGYKILSLFGITGSGKTTFMRKILGIDPENEKIPPTSTSRTTTYNFEAIIAESEYYQACINFLNRKNIFYIITDCLFEAIKKYHISKDLEKAFNVLFEDTTQTFRLKYIIGNLDGNIEIKKKYSDIITRCEFIYKDAYQVFYSDSNHNYDDKEKFEIDDLIYEEVTKSKQFDEAGNIILNDISEKLFNNVNKEKGEIIFDKNGSEWPLGYYFKTKNRSEFIKELHNFIGIQKKMWGKVLTPLVDNVRISGPFGAKWLNSYPKLAFIDGKGIGHAIQQSIPTNYLEIFEKSDYILIIDEATKSMQQSTRDIITGIVKHGYLTKMVICFSKYDELRGDNFESDEDKIFHIQNTFRQLCNDIKVHNDEYGYQLVKDLEDIQDSKFFYFPNDHEVEINNKFMEEISKFFRYLGVSLCKNNSYPNTFNTFITPELKTENKYEKKISFDEIEIKDIRSNKNKSIQKKIILNYNEDFKEALDTFLELWRAKLNLSSKMPGQSEHWTRIKALTRRFGLMDESSYQNLKPIDDFVDSIQTVMYMYAKELNVDDKILQNLSSINRCSSRKYIQSMQIEKWKNAFLRSGTGSTSRRNRDIDNLFIDAKEIAIKELMNKTRSIIEQY